MKKRILPLLTILVLLCTLTTGLTASAEEGITIQFWNAFTGSDGDILREIVNRFNQGNEAGITIEMDIMPGSTLAEKLMPSITTGTAPALVLAGNLDVPMYAQNGGMIPLDDFFEVTGVDQADFMPAALTSLQYEGSQIMLPMQWFTTYLYYNIDLFEKAGLDPNMPPATWEEVAEYAAQITDPDRNVYGVGFCVSGGVSWFNSMFLSNGGEILDVGEKKSLLNSEENLKTLQYIQAVVENGDSPVGNTGADLDNLMMADRLGMVINGPWMVAGLRSNEINFGVAPMPSGSEAVVGVAETTGFCIPAGTTDVEKAAAYAFIAYWNTTEICKEWSLRNGFPPYLYSVAEDPDVQADPIVNVFSKIAEYGVGVGEGLTSMSQINSDILFPLIENVIAGNDAQTELEAASDKIDEILNRE